MYSEFGFKSVVFLRSPLGLELLDFLYRGEANVFQVNLHTFLSIAEELQVKGLMGSTDNDLRLMRKSDYEVAPIEIHLSQTIFADSLGP